MSILPRWKAKVGHEAAWSLRHFQCIIPKHTRPVINEIDGKLAKYYRVENEKLDFILNYDINYRIGQYVSWDEGEREQVDVGQKAPRLITVYPLEAAS